MRGLNTALVFAVHLVMLSCAPNVEEEVKDQWEDGSPKVVYIYNEAGGEKVQVGERHFFANGQLRIEGQLKQGRRHGKWTSYYEDGKLWSEGMYHEGLDDGIRNVWHANGQKYYEGMFTKGKKTGLWRFYDESGALVKQEEY